MKEDYSHSQILLSLSREIAAVRNKNELLELLNNKLPALFPVVGFGITLVNEDNTTHSPFVVDVDQKIKNIEFDELVSLKYPVNDGVFNLIVEEDEPVNMDVDEMVAFAEAPAYVQYWKKINVKKAVGIPVKVGQKKLGCFILLYSPSYQAGISEQLFKGVGAQISVAISNIIGVEEILKRENEKTILLSLSNEISSLKNRSDLFKVVNQRIKNLFSITELAFAKIDDDGKTYSTFLLDLGKKITSETDFEETTSRRYDVTDAIFSHVINSEDPVLFIVQEILGKPNMPEFVHFWNKVGFTKVLCAPLRAVGINIGMVVLHIDADNTINPKSILLKGVCAQLSVAVSNIIANEKIKKADEEKSLLLSFSHEISTARDKEGLRLIIKQYLKNIFHIQEYIITTRNADGETYSYFLHDSKAEDPADEGWRIMQSNRIPVKGAFIGAALQSEEAIFDIDELLRDGNIYFPAAGFWRAAGAKRVMGFRLKVADNDVGLLVIQPGQVNTQLLKGIAAQLAIAIANIVAIEEITEREKEKSLLLSLSNEIASLKNRNDFFNVVNKMMRNSFPLNNLESTRSMKMKKHIALL